MWSTIQVWQEQELVVCGFVLKFNRSSLPEMIFKKGVLDSFTKFTGKQLCQSFCFIKVAGLRPATLLKKRLWRKCLPVNFGIFICFWFKLCKIFVKSSKSSVQIIFPMRLVVLTPKSNCLINFLTRNTEIIKCLTRHIILVGILFQIFQKP